MLWGWVEVSKTQNQELLQLLGIIRISTFLSNDYYSLKIIPVFSLLLFFVCFETGLEFSSIFTCSLELKAR